MVRNRIRRQLRAHLAGRPEGALASGAYLIGVAPSQAAGERHDLRSDLDRCLDRLEVVGR